MKEIQLNRGFVAIVDDDDFDKVSTKKWTVSITRGFYVTVINVSQSNNKQVTTQLSRFIMGVDKTGDKRQVVFKNSNRMDFRKENLVLELRSTVYLKVGLRSHNTSGFTGVSWDKRSKQWEAYITRGNSKVRLGSFKSKKEAAAAYEIMKEKYLEQNNATA